MTLTLVIVAHMMRMTRAAIINLLASPYIEMARLKGVSKAKVILRHALPNAWAPIATVIAFNLAYLVVGVVVVEVVFVYPGIGQLMVDAVTSRDIPVVQACALIFAATYIILNLIADIIGIVTNPRLLASEMTNQGNIMTDKPATYSAAAEVGMVRKRRTRWERIWIDLKKAPLSAWFGMIVIFLYCLTALFAPLAGALWRGARFSGTLCALGQRPMSSAPTRSAAMCFPG